MIIAETPRLILRHFTASDINALIPILSDPEVMRYSIDGVKTKSQTAHFLERILDYYERYHFSLYALTEKEARQLIGFCGLLPWKWQRNKEVELGYRLAKQYWGKGLATEAATATIDYAWQKLAIPRIFCIIEPANQRSIRVAQKLGMVYIAKDIFYDLPVNIYSLSKPD